MELTVKFKGAYRVIPDQEEFTLQFNDSVTVKKAVEKIGKELPQIKKRFFASKIEVLPSNTLILLNEKEIGVLNGLKTTLEDGDEMVIIPVSHGG